MPVIKVMPVRKCNKCENFWRTDLAAYCPKCSEPKAYKARSMLNDTKDPYGIGTERWYPDCRGLYSRSPGVLRRGW